MLDMCWTEIDGCLNQATTELRKAAVMKMFTSRPMGSSVVVVFLVALKGSKGLYGCFQK